MFDYRISCINVKVRKDVFAKSPFIYEMVDCIWEMVNDNFFMVKKRRKINEMNTFGFKFFVFKISLCSKKFSDE